MISNYFELMSLFIINEHTKILRFLLKGAHQNRKKAGVKNRNLSKKSTKRNKTTIAGSQDLSDDKV